MWPQTIVTLKTRNRGETTGERQGVLGWLAACLQFCSSLTLNQPPRALSFPFSGCELVWRVHLMLRWPSGDLIALIFLIPNFKMAQKRPRMVIECNELHFQAVLLGTLCVS